MLLLVGQRWCKDKFLLLVRLVRLIPYYPYPLESKVMASLLYFSGLSYRKVSMFGGFSYEAIRLWCNALKNVLPKPRRKQLRIVAVNEMKAKLGKEQFFIWIARDIDTKEVLAFRVSFTISSLDAELFLREVLKYCIGKP